ncbi:hypothetical protein PILCRDRAFT_824023 [Piloderma croceum F 1598]|uniref:Uncharacterized protein n=1 Tax=Piloderma croceum (strain F 1598) TaxID=765440 RepID=A0A0C3FFZ9_PILCF|nr:hypothetical protein PILCRDRAFT_824023 [Piloderma croceum F 1598]
MRFTKKHCPLNPVKTALNAFQRPEGEGELDKYGNANTSDGRIGVARSLLLNDRDVEDKVWMKSTGYVLR